MVPQNVNRFSLGSETSHRFGHWACIFAFLYISFSNIMCRIWFRWFHFHVQPMFNIKCWMWISQRCILLSQVPANVYVKKTALGQQTIDISGLAAPSSEKKDLEAANPSQEVRIGQLTCCRWWAILHDFRRCEYLPWKAQPAWKLRVCPLHPLEEPTVLNLHLLVLLLHHLLHLQLLPLLSPLHLLQPLPLALCLFLQSDL